MLSWRPDSGSHRNFDRSTHLSSPSRGAKLQLRSRDVLRTLPPWTQLRADPGSILCRCGIDFDRIWSDVGQIWRRPTFPISAEFAPTHGEFWSQLCPGFGHILPHRADLRSMCRLTRAVPAPQKDPSEGRGGARRCVSVAADAAWLRATAADPEGSLRPLPLQAGAGQVGCGYERGASFLRALQSSGAVSQELLGSAAKQRGASGSIIRDVGGIVELWRACAISKYDVFFVL